MLIDSGFITSSLRISGSYTQTGNAVITGSLTATQGVTGSLFGTASWANNVISASFATSAANATSASFATSAANATSASIAANAVTASFATSAANATSASIAANAVTASRALNANTASFASFAITASISDNAVTASRALNANTASFATLAANATSASFATSTISASYALSASYATGSGFASSASFTLSSSIASRAVTASYAITASYLSGSVDSASYAVTAVTASRALNANTASFATSAASATSASFATLAANATTASFATLAASATSASYATFANTASSADNFNVRNTLTVTTIVAQVITSSTDFITGSSRFGTIITNTHQFTGSVSVSGSITVTAGVTNDLTASRAIQANTASFATNAASATSASFATSAASTTTASFATSAISASFATNAANATSASFATSAANATSASIATNAVTASRALNANTASYVQLAASASYALTASHALNAGGAAAASNLIFSGSVSASVDVNSTQIFRIISGSSTFMQVNNAGNVGIGTTVPGAKLDVLGGIQAAIIRTSDASTLYTTYQVNSTTVVGYIGNGNGIVSAGGTSNFGIRSEADLLFAAGGNAERVRITSGGNVGIGTTAPAVALDVVGRIILKTATAGLYVYTSGSSFADGIRIGDISTDNGFMYLAYVSQSKYGSIQPGDNLAYRNLNLNHQGGNVGIGFLNPTGKLHISSSTSINHALRIEAEAASDTFPVVYIEGNKSGGAPAVATLVELKSNTDARGRGINMTVADGNTRWFAGVPYLGGGYQIGYDGSANALPFYPASSSLFITTGGSVGIGLSNPNNKLVVNGAIGFASASVLTPFAQRSTNYHTIYEPAGGVALYLGNTVDPGNYYDNTNHYFRNRGGGTTYAIINSAGSVGIGTTSPAYKLDVTGDIRATSDVIAFSDARVKDNVETITNALAKVISLRGVYYNRNDIEDKSRKVGVIAQEVKEILPEVVQQDNKGNYSVAYGNMVSIFIEAIKEQQSQIDDLQKQINYLAENK